MKTNTHNARRVYPLGDLPTRQEANLLGCKMCEIRAVATGKFRRPFAGEWYLRGAGPTAYRGANKMLSTYKIAKLIGPQDY